MPIYPYRCRPYPTPPNVIATPRVVYYMQNISLNCEKGFEMSEVGSSKVTCG
jgi:hypothetical protein